MVFLSHPAERLRWVIDNYYNGHPKKLADRIKVPPATFTHILKHGRNPSWKIMASILKLHRDINPDWLLYDGGERLRGLKGEELSKEDLRKYLRQLIEVLDE